MGMQLRAAQYCNILAKIIEMMPENTRCSRFPSEGNTNKLQGLATCILIKLTLLAGYNLSYSADSGVQFLVAFFPPVFINIILDKKIFLHQQDSRVRKSSDSLSNVFCEMSEEKTKGTRAAW